MLQRRAGATGDQICQLLCKMRAIILVEPDMIDVEQRQARFDKAIGDGLRWKAGPILEPAEAFLFRGGDQPAVLKESGRRIAVKSV
jgi:hypothetical protein